ncbi:hypothetical protein CI593_00590 [Fischerella thermalis CCMEE 5194]|nr:hypothetical protein CI593_00590 [Fischerella thermalis CCMEE 5194]
MAPSQICPQCGYKKKKELFQRVHNCDNCNLIADRDVAAAMIFTQTFFFLIELIKLRI